MAAFFASLDVVRSGFASLLPPNANAGSAYKMDEETSKTASLLVGFESRADDASIVTVHFLPSFTLFFFFKEEEDAVVVNNWWRDVKCAEDESVNIMCATSIGRCCCRALRSEVSFVFCFCGEKLFVFLFAQQPSLVKTAMRKSGKYPSREVNVMNSF